jgi:methyl-accepting chemotaxis protein
VAEAADGTARIASAIGTVATATAGSRGVAEETSRGAGELRALADRLHTSVGRFTL